MKRLYQDSPKKFVDCLAVIRENPRVNALNREEANLIAMLQERIIKFHHNDDYDFIARRILDHQIDHESKKAKKSPKNILAQYELTPNRFVLNRMMLQLTPS